MTNMQDHIPITLLFADGVSRRLQVPCAGKLIDAAVEAGLNLLTDCSNGQCGTCTAQLLSGSVLMDDYDPSVLPDDERDAGSVLPCVCRAQSACAIEFPYDSSEAMEQEPEAIDGEVLAITEVAHEVVRLEVQIDEALNFEPGQYVRLQPQGTEIQRSYSMANKPGSKRLEFFIRQVPGGTFSSWLAQAQVGAKVQLSTPRGTFFLRDEVRPRLFVAGGTGIAPFLSMLRSMDEKEQACPVTLLIGARTQGHFFAQQELQTLLQERPQLSLRWIVETTEGEQNGSANENSGASDWHLGYPTDLIADLGLTSSTRVYLCGPPSMVDSGRRAASELGVKRADILCERFA